MGAKAYVLIRSEVGKTELVLTALRATAGITAADLLAGPYDIIAVVEGSDANAIGRLVLTRVHGLEGLNSTLTCMVVG